MVTIHFNLYGKKALWTFFLDCKFFILYKKKKWVSI